MDDYQFKCTFPDCGKAFKARKSLKEHMRIHKGEKPYKCQYPGCGKSFTQYSSKQKHERTHTGSKPYSCSLCGKEFTQISNLRRHERVHAGDKKYECHLCHKKFSTASNLRQHMHVHDKGDTREKYSCGVCGKVYLYRSSLRKHMQEHEEELMIVVKDSDYECQSSDGHNSFIHTKVEPEFEHLNYGLNAKAEVDEQHLKKDDIFPEPDLMKYIFVDNSQTITSPGIDFKFENDELQELMRHCSKPEHEQVSLSKDNFELFPSSPCANLNKAECESDSRLLPLTPLLGSPIRDRPSLIDYPNFNVKAKSLSILIRYQGEIYYLYDRMLNRCKPSGELTIKQIENDFTNPSGCRKLCEEKHSIHSGCHDWNSSTVFSQNHNIEPQSIFDEENFLASPKMLPQEDYFPELSCSKSLFGEDKCINKEHYMCANENDKNLRHIHDAYCGHPAIMHDGHVDYIVNGRLQHPDGDHCDDHGPICVLPSPDEEYIYGFISNPMLSDCKAIAPAQKYQYFAPSNEASQEIL